MDADVFIVGYNPATRLGGDWWNHWQPGYGFRKSDWVAGYLAERGKASKSRSRIDSITQALPEVRFVETNIDARPSARKRTYPIPDTRVFDLLIAACRPKAIIAHGVDAVRYFDANPVSAHVIPSPHFIYVGNAATARIIAAVRDVMGHVPGG